MTNKFTVHSDNLEEFPSKKGGMQKTRRLMLLDASDGARLDQILELNLPPEHTAIGVGKSITVEIQEISAIFAGRPRIRGHIVGPAAK
jgi:hypothetical protein